MVELKIEVSRLMILPEFWNFWYIHAQRPTPTDVL